jgi:type I restriction enzyme, S subunit
VRYSALLKGLDCSEAKFSQLASPGSTRRIDADFFSKRFIANQELLRSTPLEIKPLAAITEKIDVGHVGSMVHAYSDVGIPLLQTQNIGQFLIDYSNCVRITEEFHASLRKSQVVPGDCLIARSGSIGNTAFVADSDPRPLNSADIIIVRADGEVVTNGYLAAFLNSPVGALQVERLASGGLQGHINLKAIEYVSVPLPTRGFQEVLDEWVRKAMNLYREALLI